jgi:phage antirepressor YoqD-like protein
MPAARVGELVRDDGSYYSMKEAADIVADKLGDRKVGRNKMFKLLRGIGILCSSESYWNQPYRNFIDRGYFYTKLKETEVGIKPVTLVTGDGLNFIYEKVSEYLNANNMEL